MKLNKNPIDNLREENLIGPLFEHGYSYMCYGFKKISPPQKKRKKKTTTTITPPPKKKSTLRKKPQKTININPKMKLRVNLHQIYFDK